MKPVIDLAASQAEMLLDEAARLGVAPEELVRAAVVAFVARSGPEDAQAMRLAVEASEKYWNALRDLAK